MDNSSVIIDQTQLKVKIAEVIEGSVNIMEKGTKNIFVELNKMREEYTSLINKFLDTCEKEGVSIDFLEDNSRSNSMERENSAVSLNLNKHNTNKTEFKKLKLDAKIRGAQMNTLHATVNQPNSKYKLNKFSGSFKVRSLTPVGAKYALAKNHESTKTLNGALTPKSLPRIKKESLNNNDRVKTDYSNISNSNLNTKCNKSNASITPNNKTPKQDIKNFIMFNQNNNYTKKFIIKQTIENSTTYKKSNSKDNKNLKNLVKKEESNINSFNINNEKSNKKLNINVQNVNINLCSNMNENNRFDDRKLSIMDIGGGPLINMENIVQTEDPIEENEHSSLKTAEGINNKSIGRLIFDSFKNKFDKFCFSAAHSDVLPLKLRVIFSKMRENVYKEYPPIEVVKDYAALLTENIIAKENYLSFYLSNPEDEKLICKSFVPSKTAQNSLNFITKEEEIILTQENISTLPVRDEIIGIFKIIFLLIRQNFEKVDETLLPEYLINKILVKLKIDNLKILFQNLICNNLLLSHEQISKIISIVEKNENVLNPTHILKSCKVAACVTFIIKEIYEYVTVKAHDSTPILLLRKHRNNLRKMKEKLYRINWILEEKFLKN